MFEKNYMELETAGYTVIDLQIPKQQLADLAKFISICSARAKELFGPNAHRLQSFERHGLDGSLVEQLMQSPRLAQFVRGWGSEYFVGAKQDNMMLEVSSVFEPLERSTCTYWHRDWRDRVVLEEKDFQTAMRNWRYFIGCTIAAIEDSCFWIVPGSHRQNDTQEQSTFRQYGKRMLQWGLDVEQRYLAEKPECGFDDFLFDYTTSMPGAVNVTLQPGQMVFFNTMGWHTGHYDRRRPRRSIQSVIGSPFFSDWADRYTVWNPEFENYDLE